MKISTLFVAMMAAGCLLTGCQGPLPPLPDTTGQPPEFSPEGASGYTSGPGGTRDLNRREIALFYRLLNASTRRPLPPDDGRRRNVSPLFPDYCIYISDAAGNLLEAEYVFPEGNFFNRDWKKHKEDASRARLLSLIKR